MGDPFFVGAFLPHWRWPHNKPEQKILANSGGVAGYTPAYTYLHCKIQNFLLVVVSKIKEKFKKNPCQQWQGSGPYNCLHLHNILLNLGDLFLVRAFLFHWRWQQVTRAKHSCQQCLGNSPHIYLHLLYKIQKDLPVVVGRATFAK